MSMSLKHAFSEQSMGGSRSFEMESWAYVQHKDFQLHILQKVEKLPANRPVIPTTEQQRLAFFRGYVSSPFKTMITYTQQMDFSRFIWSYSLNVFVRSMSMNYIQTFLASYSPDDHLYASKMIPLCIGVSWQVVTAGIFQLVASADTLSLFLHYALFGIIRSSPWDACQPGSIYRGPPGEEKKFNFTCTSTKDFIYSARKLKFNEVHGGVFFRFIGNSYAFSGTHDGKHYFEKKILPSPQSYFLHHFKNTDPLRLWTWMGIPYFFFIWLAAGAFYKQIYQKYPWKLLVKLQLALNTMYLCVVLHILYVFVNTKAKVAAPSFPEAVEAGLKFDFDMVAECIIGPPVIQLLLARSGQQVNPGRESALITFSNTVFYLFRCLTNTLVKNYASIVTGGTPVLISWFGNYPIFYQWQFYFAEMLVGQIFLKIFYILTFFVEFLIFLLTFQLLVETVVCEWKWAKRWISSVLFSVVGLMLNLCLGSREKVYLYVLSTIITALCESVVILWLYPLGRLMDDVYFHVGTPIGGFRLWIYRMIPFYYIFKITNIYKADAIVRRSKVISSGSAFPDRTKAKRWVYWVPVTLLMIGAVYSIIKYLIVLKQNWRVLLRPRPDWGPRDHIIRQLRKQFDSRDYIGSQASRYLSRHMQIKAQTPAYRLDIRYETASDRRRSTIIADNFDFAGDKKEIAVLSEGAPTKSVVKTKDVPTVKNTDEFDDEDEEDQF